MAIFNKKEIYYAFCLTWHFWKYSISSWYMQSLWQYNSTISNQVTNSCALISLLWLFSAATWNLCHTLKVSLDSKVKRDGTKVKRKTFHNTSDRWGEAIRRQRKYKELRKKTRNLKLFWRIITTFPNLEFTQVNILLNSMHLYFLIL